MSCLLFRLDAGDKFGMGHLSRCLVLANEFVGDFRIRLVIKSDNPVKVTSFLKDRIKENTVNTDFLDEDIIQQDDLSMLINEVSHNNAFLILDHYSVNEGYQLFLKENNIKWLQFDSHGKMPFYADLVLHGSPGATLDMYEPLRRNPNTEFLLGTHYAIIGKQFGELREQTKIKNSVKKIMICFGGGNDRGATLNCLIKLDRKQLIDIAITVIVSSKNPFLSDIENELSGFHGAELLLDTTNIEKVMISSDLAILSPGILSYEAASLGLPMLQITIADNQFVNAAGWKAKGCAEFVGDSSSFSSSNLNNKIKSLLFDKVKLEKMSYACFNAVDGQGAKRVKDKILDII